MNDCMPVPGYPHVYASSDGEIFSHRSGNAIKLRQRIDKDGYMCVNVKTSAGRSNNTKQPVHRLVLLAWYGPHQNGQGRTVSRHLDGLKTNNCKDNLRWGTDKENHDDAVRHGTLGKGMKAPRRKLTYEQVVSIRKMIGGCTPYRQIAERFNIHKDYVYQLKMGRAW